MKKVGLLFFGAILLQNSALANIDFDALKNNIKRPPQKKGVLKGCVNPTFICEEDVNDKGYVIIRPGCYVLAEDIVFKPRGPNASNVAITIKASNVSLDLGGHTLSASLRKRSETADETNNQALLLGILANDVSELHIGNGSVTDFKDAGIRIQHSEDIVIYNLSVLRTGIPSSFGGLQINESQDILIDHLRALYNFGAGMYLHAVTKSTILNSNFDDNFGGNVAPQFFTGSNLVAAGAYVDSSVTTESSVILFKNCSFNRNQGGGEGVGMEIGPYSLLTVRDVTILGCEFLDNHMNGISTLFNDSSGIVLLQVENYLIQDSIASGQRHPSLPGPTLAVSGATGFSINISNNGIIENCQANDNVGQGSSSIGIRIRASENVLVKNCQASANINTGSGVAFGFYTDPDGLNAFLPAPNFNSSLVFDSNVAQNNASATGLSGGFKLANLRRSSIINNISQENTGYGMLVIDSNSPPLAFDNVFKNNTLQDNSIAGISDQVVGTNNAYFLNTARSNGPLGVTNYVGLPAGTPIVTWSIAGGFPAPPINPFANLNIVP